MPLKTTAGQLLINSALPPAMRDYNRVLDKKGAGKLYADLAREHPDEYREISKRLADIARDSAHEFGGYSFGVKHLQKSEAARGVMSQINEAVQGVLARKDLTPKQRDELIIKATGGRQKELVDAVYKEALAAKNPLAFQVLSGSRGNPVALNSLLGGDLLYENHKGDTVPVPITRSYSEGLTPAQHWVSSYGARFGLVGTKLAVAKAGYFSKQLGQATHRLVVEDADDPDEKPGLRGLPVETSDPDNEGALLAHDVGGYKRNTVLTPKILKDLRDKGEEHLLVRSAITSAAPSGGVYARDIGIKETGSLPSRGSFVGLQAAQSVGEPLSQGMLSSKHGGGVAGQSKNRSGFPLLDAMIQVPHVFPGGATHAEEDGRITDIKDAPAGGKIVMIGQTEHYVPPDLELKVKKGDEIEAGDTLSDGHPNPAMLAKHKGLGEAQRYFTGAFQKAMGDFASKPHRRNIEVLARGLINHVRFTNEHGEYAPDDVAPYSLVARNWQPREGTRKVKPLGAMGKYLESPVLHYTIGTKIRPSVVRELNRFKVADIDVHDTPPPFESEMVRAANNLQHDPDWMVQQYGSGLKGSLLDSAHRSKVSDPTGSSFVPSLAKAVDFGNEGLFKRSAVISAIEGRSATLAKMAEEIAADERPYRDRAEMYAIDGRGRVFGGLYPNGNFGVFGGGVDPGETPVEAAAREFPEECGYEVTDARMVPVDPHVVEWKPPYKTAKQAKRAKEFKGSRTFYVVGKLGKKIPGAKGDEVGRTEVRPYTLAEARKLMGGDMGDPELAEGILRRHKVFDYLEEFEKKANEVLEKQARYNEFGLYDCPECGGRLLDGSPKSGYRFRGSGACMDCGHSMPLVHSGLKRKGTYETNEDGTEKTARTEDGKAETSEELAESVKERLEEMLSGLYVHARITPEGKREIHLDCMDWGDDKLTKLVKERLKGYSDGDIYVANEEGKPSAAEGWERVPFPKMAGWLKEADLRRDVSLQPQQSRVADEVVDQQHDTGRSRMLLYHGLGSGKTLSALAAAEALGAPATAIVPASLRNNFTKERDRFVDPSSGVPMSVMSHTGLALGNEAANPDTLIVDEAQRFRNSESGQTKALLEAAKRAKNVMLLSGTPVVNSPGDFAPMYSILTGKGMAGRDFEERYTSQGEHPNLLARLFGARETGPGLVRKDDLRRNLAGKIDYYKPAKSDVEVQREDVNVDLSPEQERVINRMMSDVPESLMSRALAGRLSERDMTRFSAFLTGPRQVGLSTAPFKRQTPSEAFAESPKLQAAMANLRKTLDGNPKAKALIFSNFIDAGIKPYAAGLADAGIPAAAFTGALSDKERKAVVDDYNNDRIRAVLLGPSGTEGLSFRGTRLTQELDPHWNTVRGQQAAGRGLRYDSHDGMPDAEKNMRIERYFAKGREHRPGWFGRLLGRETTHGFSSDDYIRDSADRKAGTTTELLELLQEIGTPIEKKAGPTEGMFGTPARPSGGHGRDGADLGTPNAAANPYLARQFAGGDLRSLAPEAFDGLFGGERMATPSADQPRGPSAWKNVDQFGFGWNHSPENPNPDPVAVQQSAVQQGGQPTPSAALMLGAAAAPTVAAGAASAIAPKTMAAVTGALPAGAGVAGRVAGGVGKVVGGPVGAAVNTGLDGLDQFGLNPLGDRWGKGTVTRHELDQAGRVNSQGRSVAGLGWDTVSSPITSILQRVEAVRQMNAARADAAASAASGQAADQQHAGIVAATSQTYGPAWRAWVAAGRPQPADGRNWIDPATGKSWPVGQLRNLDTYSRR